MFGIPTVIADVNLVDNGGFETGDLTSWWTNGATVVPDGHTGNYAVYLDDADSFDQTFASPVTPSYELSFWGRTVETDEEDYVVVWIYYNDGEVFTNTLGPLNNTWQKFTAFTIMKPIDKIAFRTYDETYSGEPWENTYREIKQIDDIELNWEDAGKIIVRKEIDWGLDSSYMNGWVFNFSSSWGESFSLGDGEEHEKIVDPGEYYVFELSPSGWSVSMHLEGDGWTEDSAGNYADFEVGQGETVTVVFTNRPPDFVIPEAPFGTLLLIGAMLLAYRLRGKSQINPTI